MPNMEIDHRAFEAVNINLRGVENGVERFRKHDLYDGPPIALWRNNLTALSQKHNLYFVASRSAVLVYRPEFPFQTLGRTAHLVIPKAVENPTTAGYIDPHHPHSINHLLVGDLGTEEILLLATDSGNVTAYYTRAIQEAVNRNPFSLSTNASSDVVGLQPFFTQWVHESAWGLSIHTEARMIAVSANTPYHVAVDDHCAKVTIFAFALTDQNEGPEKLDTDNDEDLYTGPSQLEWHEWDPALGYDHPPRNKNYKTILAGFDGHDSNIPCVSFVNTSQDPLGKWLMSTDIDGATKLWQIWLGSTYRSWDLAERGPSRGLRRRREGGWLVAALDPKIFSSAWSMEEFCGHSRAAQCYGNPGESYDLTNVVRLRTPGHSHAHPLLDDASDDSDDAQEWDSATNLWSDVDVLDEDEHLHNPHEANDGFEPTASGSTRLEDSLETSSDTYFTTSEGSVRSRDGHQLVLTATDAEAIPLPIRSESHADGSSFSVSVVVENRNPDNMVGETSDELVQYDSSSDGFDNDFSSVSHHSGSSISSIAHRTSQDKDDADRGVLLSRWKSLSQADQSTEFPVIPMLHCTASNLKLLNAPAADYPHVFCANILKQALPPILESHNFAQFDRLNMLQIIPELGIIIIASQIGRCAVCVLTKNEKTGTLGLRADWTLPTRKQETKNLRPLKPLLGIAVSPIQGRTISNYSELSTEDESSIPWGKDGVLGGVTTTFDPNVVLLKGGGTATSGSEIEVGGAESSILGAERESKRKRLSYDWRELKSSRRREQRSWAVPHRSEPWNAAENSRRYRLMLTYSDYTVITYELSRGVERQDIAQSHVSALDLVD